MSKVVIVRINEKLIPEFQIKYNKSENSAQKSTVHSWHDITINQDEELVLILAANLVLTTQISIPSKNDEVIKQSIPYALEEYLSNDINENHYSYLTISDQKFMVSIIKNEIISKIKELLNKAQLDCNQLYSEIFTCPSRQESTALLMLEKYVVIREDMHGTCLKKNMISKYLQLSEKKKHNIYSEEDLKIEKSLNIKLIKTDLSILQAKTLCGEPAVNMFQGDFAKEDDSSRSISPFRKLIVVSLVLVFSWLSINLYQLWHNNSVIDDLKRQQKNLFIELIPNANQTELNDPYAALLSRLKLSENNQNSGAEQGFIKALSYVGQSLEQNPTIQIISLRQRNAKLEINLQAQNISLLNQFQSSLEQNVFSMRVKTGTRNTNQDGISSIITLEQL